ncbi:MAG: type II toxin-antitoxin system RelE/ParE family toxin [Betaproteobacteria bacterium]|nr:type II toxin-antitoxin system RelE/ParE family toxin [Betaproteobacteria bacterium]
MQGLGAQFRSDVRNRIRNWPLAAQIERGDIRRMMLSRFPYKLLYSVEMERIYIIALAHLHRAPDYWTTRSK